LKYSQDLTEIATDKESLKETFLLTEEEAQEPDSPITRKDFAILVSRTLDLYNCIEERQNLGLPLEDERIDTSIDHIQESLNKVEETPQETQVDQPTSELEILVKKIENAQQDSVVEVNQPACTSCPCPFESNLSLNLSSKDKFFVIYGSLDNVISKSKFFEFNPLSNE